MNVQALNTRLIQPIADRGSEIVAMVRPRLQLALDQWKVAAGRQPVLYLFLSILSSLSLVPALTYLCFSGSVLLGSVAVALVVTLSSMITGALFLGVALVTNAFLSAILTCIAVAAVSVYGSVSAVTGRFMQQQQKQYRLPQEDANDDDETPLATLKSQHDHDDHRRDGKFEKEE